MPIVRAHINIRSAASEHWVVSGRSL